MAFVLSLSIVNANSSSSPNSTSSINLKLDELFNVTATSSAYSLVKVYEVQNNSLRKGFEPFYYISNQVIDYIRPSSLSGNYKK